MEKTGLCACPVKAFVNWGMGRLRAFTVADVAVFKVLLLTVGALFGVHLAGPLKKRAPLLWLTAAASYAYLIWRMVFVHEEQSRP